MLAVLKDLKNKPTSLTDDPLFRTTNGALLFALNYTHGGMKKPSLTVLMGGGRKGRGLSGLDGAAQAGMIQLELAHLPDQRRALLVARYAVATVPCECGRPCCRRWIENPEWSEPINWLTQYVLEAGLTGNISHYRFRRALVSRHFGVKESFITMAAQSGVERHTAGERYKKIHEHLKDEEKKARWELEGILQKGGVVG